MTTPSLPTPGQPQAADQPRVPQFRTATEAGIPQRRRGMPGTARDMVLSMLVILAIVGVLVALVARPNTVVQPPVDVASAAQGAQPALGFTPSVPASLPAGWSATNADAERGADGVMTWLVDFTTNDGRYAAIRQASGASDRWEGLQVTDGAEAGTREIAGRSWIVRSRLDRNRTSFVLREGPYRTVVTGTTSDAALVALAASLSMPVAAAPSASPTP